MNVTKSPQSAIRLIATDLDGTLLNSAHSITPRTDRAIRAALQRGVLFTVATGKTFPSTTRHIQSFAIEIPVICGNGTLIHAPDGTILQEEPIAREYAIEAVQLAQAAGVTPVVYVGHGLLCREIDENVEVLLAHHEPMPTVVPDMASALRSDFKPYKLVLIHQDPVVVAELQPTLEQVFDGRAQVMRTGLDTIVEVLPSGVSKGTALQFLLDYLDIAPEQTISFGDNCNDLDMIRRSGIGVAMGHAPDDLHEAADFVTRTNDEDGVGYALEHLVLNGYRSTVDQ